MREGQAPLGSEPAGYSVASGVGASVEPAAGIEPAAYGLQNHRSAI